MIKDNSSLKANTKLYKYMDLEKFLSLIVTKKLCFCNQKKLKELDPYEGAMTRGELVREEYIKFLYDFVKKKGSFKYLKLIDGDTEKIIDLREEFKLYNDELYYIDCWHINTNESLAMWKVFSNNKNSIAISTTNKKLKSSIKTEDKEVNIQEVSYMDLLVTEKIMLNLNAIKVVKDTIYMDTEILRGFCEEGGLLRKTNYYSYEKELRLYFEDNNNDDITKFIDIDPNSLIDEIIISPNCDEWFIDILNDILVKYSLDKKVRYSEIRQNNIKLSESEKKWVKDYIMNLDFQEVN